MRHIVLPLLIALFLSACAGLPRPADPPTDALAHAALLEQEGSHLAAAGGLKKYPPPPGGGGPGRGGP
ncbi:hypothetical protein, partial [Ectothiorhodospira lacustris]|uniref:hypothetical protein n=1 Tax=Ectothiorhodospira lacustris TaxID=2899127 RepID=UPI001EE97577